MVKHVISGSSTECLPLSDAVCAGDFVFLSGLVGFGPDGRIVEGGIAAETDRIMADAADILKRASVVAGLTIAARVEMDFVAFTGD